jgi:hypothetical protein
VVVARCDDAPCFEVVLGGLGAERDSVTSADLPRPCVTPVSDGSRVATRPGDRFTIAYEDRVGDELALAIESTGPAPRRLSLRRHVGPGEPAFALRLDERGWELEEDAKEAPRVGIYVAYRGTSKKPRPEVAREMEERLRTLGYVR